MTRITTPAAALLAAAVLFVPGCKGDGKLACHPVRGQMFIDGKPAYGGKVFFFPVSPPSDHRAKCPIGQVDESGTFTVTTYTEGDGAPVGEYILCFEWPSKHPISGSFDGGDRLGGKYMKKDDSQYRFTVQAGPNETTKFELKSTPPKGKSADPGILGGGDR